MMSSNEELKLEQSIIKELRQPVHKTGKPFPLFPWKFGQRRTLRKAREGPRKEFRRLIGHAHLV